MPQCVSFGGPLNVSSPRVAQCQQLALQYCIVPCVTGGLAYDPQNSVWGPGMWGHNSDPNCCNHVLAQALGHDPNACPIPGYTAVAPPHAAPTPP